MCFGPFFQVDDMLKRRLGDEEALFAELTKQYCAEEDPGVAALVRRVPMRLMHISESGV